MRELSSPESRCRDVAIEATGDPASSSELKNKLPTFFSLTLAERDVALAERDVALAERDVALAEQVVVTGSKIWKLFKPYRAFRN